jgi:hypothetical protein
MPTPGAPVPADRHQQGGRSPAQRLVRQLPRDGVPGSSCTPAASAPALGAVIGLQDPARQDRAIGLQTLADHDQAELIQAAERGQVRAAEGSVRHVEVFQMGGVGTSILGRPRHLPRDRRASHHPTSDYTLNCEEPGNRKPAKADRGRTRQRGLSRRATPAGAANSPRTWWPGRAGAAGVRAPACRGTREPARRTISPARGP